MIVRQANENDADGYTEAASKFHAASPMHGVIDFDKEGYKQFFLQSLANDSVGVWVCEVDKKIVGICGAISYPLYFNPSSLVVQELWWWLDPSARGSGAGSQMFKNIEQWAKAKNADALFMIALEDERASKMERLYARAGFKPMERTFIKEV